MGLTLNYANGQTPLDEEETSGLRIPTIATRVELDEFEQLNIEQAVQWTLGRSFKPGQVFTESFLMTVHRRMFSDVWAWAGQYRKTNKNIGTDRWNIPTELRNLLDDTRYWHEHDTYRPDEIALRFKHRLVSIHCFANGNGRHSRLMADIIIDKIFGNPVFTWGAKNLSTESDARVVYLRALKAADQGNYDLLLQFARS